MTEITIGISEYKDLLIARVTMDALYALFSTDSTGFEKESTARLLLCIPDEEALDDE